MDGKIVPSQTAQEVTGAEGQTEMADIFRDFGKSVVALRDMMDQDRSFSDMEQLYIENHFQVIQMSYLRWKRKHRPKPNDPTQGNVAKPLQEPL